MPDLAITTITRANSTTKLKAVRISEAVAIAAPVYDTAVDGKHANSDADDASKNAVHGLALTPGAADGSWIDIVTEGPVVVDATLTKGVIYVLSRNPGKIRPSSELAAGDHTTIIGVATDTNTLDVQFNSSGALIA